MTNTPVINGTLPECIADIAERFGLGETALLSQALSAPYADKHPDGRQYPGATGVPDERRLWYGIVSTLKPNNLVECGVNWGVSTIQFLSAIRDNQTGKLTSVDVREFIEGNRPVGAAIPKSLRKNFRLLPGWDAVTYLKGHHESIDFFFEDTNHTYETTRLIYETVQSRLSPGALCVSHDPISAPPVVRGMVDAGCAPIIYHINGKGTGIAVWQNQ